MNALTRFQSYWQGLDRRSRLTLSVAFGALVVGLFWAFVWQPVTTKRAALLTRIPQLEVDLQRMRAEAEEIKRINALPAIPVSNTARVQADATSLRALFGTTARVANENRGLVVSIPSIGYGALLDRLEQTAARYRARVTALSIKSIGAENVSAELTIVDEANYANKPNTNVSSK
jgi:type II secretory pathway component PulM